MALAAARRGTIRTRGWPPLARCVEVEMVSELGDSERLTFDIVPDRAADFTAGFLGGRHAAGAGDHGTP